jgi:hypothetical protein
VGSPAYQKNKNRTEGYIQWIYIKPKKIGLGKNKKFN